MPWKGLYCLSNRFWWVGYFSPSRLFLSRLYLSLPPPTNLLIIILFEEDNIFGTIASVAYGIWSSDTKTYMRLIITKQWKLFTVCTEQVRSPYIEHAASGIPYSLGRGGTICPGSRPAGVTTRCPRIVTECLPTRSMVIKMYKFTISGYVLVYVHCIYSQSISCRRSLSLFVWHDNSIRKHEYE